MLTFHETADPQSLEIKRGSLVIGELRWHDTIRVMLLTTRLVYLDLSEMTEIQAKWAEIKEKILSEAFPLEPQAATGWTTVWPTEPGRYWAYGQLFGKPVHPDTKPRLEMCDVKQIGPQDNPSFVYVACGNFMYKSEAAEVWFMKANEPQLPTVKDAENGNNNC